MMDERELAQRIKALSKSVAQNEAPESILALMTTIKNDAKPTEDMLRSTRAGIFIGKLRSNPNKDIGKLANEIVIKWRKLVDAEKAAKGQGGRAASAKNGSPSTPTPTSIAAAAAAAAAASPAPPQTASNKPTRATRRAPFQGRQGRYQPDWQHGARQLHWHGIQRPGIQAHRLG